MQIATDLTRFARAALVRFFRAVEAVRPIDRKVAKAEFQGVCVAADALGLAMTPDHMHLMVLDAVREQPEPRPTFRPAGNGAQNAWDDAAIATLVAKIESGSTA